VPSFARRSHKLERIDTGDYSLEEYERFMVEIRFINRFLGDSRALKKSLLRDIKKNDLREFSVLDVGAGSGELLRQIAEFARASSRKARLVGLDLNEISTATIKRESADFPDIATIRGDAVRLPFSNSSFDYAICSLFTHHLTDEIVVHVLREMSRVAARGVYVIDLHRHAAAYRLFRLFCFAFRISPLVRDDGSLSILRSFTPGELGRLGVESGLREVSVDRVFPFRLVLAGR
jgi:ubiquinone/menaquinone biosynthesis C-methylase UbiE